MVPMAICSRSTEMSRNILLRHLNVMYLVITDVIKSGGYFKNDVWVEKLRFSLQRCNVSA